MYSRRHTSFALWAPTAFRIVLELKRNHGICEAFELKRGEKGVWRTVVPGDLEGVAYTYHVRCNGKWRETIDPYAICGGANSMVSCPFAIKKGLRFQTYPLPQNEKCLRCNHL